MRERYTSAVATAVSRESKAYGFALTIWSCGAFLIAEQGAPRSADVLAFAGGALTAMALVLVAALGGPARPLEPEQPPQRAFGAMHVVSVFAAILVAWGLAAVLSGVVAFFFAALAGVVVYQALVAVEIALAMIDR